MHLKSHMVGACWWPRQEMMHSTMTRNYLIRWFIWKIQCIRQPLSGLLESKLHNSTLVFIRRWLAWFSNWDSAYGNRWEYEVAAPGTNVRSLLPNGGYANWNGTSMAAPVVSGIAALLRTAYPDKQDYNSRFVMGQLLVGGVNESGGQSSLAKMKLLMRTVSLLNPLSQS